MVSYADRVPFSSGGLKQEVILIFTSRSFSLDLCESVVPMSRNLHSVLGVLLVIWGNPVFAQGAGSWGNGLIGSLFTWLLGALVLLVIGTRSFLSLRRGRHHRFLKLSPFVAAVLGGIWGVTLCTGPACGGPSGFILVALCAAAGFLVSAVVLKTATLALTDHRGEWE